MRWPPLVGPASNKFRIHKDGVSEIGVIVCQRLYQAARVDVSTAARAISTAKYSNADPEQGFYSVSAIL